MRQGLSPANQLPVPHAQSREALESEPPQQKFQPFSFQLPPTKLTYHHDERLSRRLSRVIRHDKGAFKLNFFPNMTTLVDDVLRLPIMRDLKATREQLLSVVYHNQKQPLQVALGGRHPGYRCGPGTLPTHRQ